MPKMTKATTLIALAILIATGDARAQSMEVRIAAAEAGDAQAQIMLGEAYNAGVGVEQDYEQAVYWHQEAAEQGHADAQFQMGSNYSYGIGVEQDGEQAAYWWKKAAEQGHVTAKFMLDKGLRK